MSSLLCAFPAILISSTQQAKAEAKEGQEIEVRRHVL
jgi:hypothetical protein